MIKLPTAKDNDEGVGTGKPDFALDAILSKEVNERVELSGYGGFIVRGDPDGVDLTNGLRWGVGAGLPSRKSLRFTAELHGERYLTDTVTLTTPLIAADGQHRRSMTDLNSPVNATFGLTWQGKQRRLCRRRDQLEPAHGQPEPFLLRVRGSDGGFERLPVPPRLSPGRAGLCRAAAPAAAAAPPPPAPQHTLTVTAQCDPCTVEVGKVSTVTATALDSIGCAVTYAWSAPTGHVHDRTARQTPWTAPKQHGHGAGDGDGDVPERREDGERRR